MVTRREFFTRPDESIKPCCTPHVARPGGCPPILEETASASLHPGSTLTILLPGGTFLMGTDYEHAFIQDGEGPVRPVFVSSFRIDPYPVTNARFARFIAATGYRTEAERFGWSFVFWHHLPQDHAQTLVRDGLIVGGVAAAPWWYGIAGARWDAPEGPGSSIADRLDHPVVHVSWNDARAFCAWSNQRLPTEAEWEYAARGGLEQKLYPWGDTLLIDGHHRANIWQGNFPSVDTAEDGFAGTCPVDAFSPNGFELYSMTGNTWEWCADWFSPDLHRLAAQRDLNQLNSTQANPTGPHTGTARVMKGGSFLCHHSYCNRYRVAARSANTPDSSCSNLGFRCVTRETAPNQVQV